MLFIKNAKYLKDYLISIEFSSGEKGIADFKDIIQKYPAAAPLRDPAKFQAFYLDEWPTLAWNCDFDLSPNMIFELWTENHLSGPGKLPTQVDRPQYKNMILPAF